MPGALAKRGNRITLRMFEEEDFDLWQRGAADPELRHLTGNAAARNRSDLEDAYDDDDVTMFLVCIDDDAPHGPVDADAVERIGVAVVKEWGRTPFVGTWLVPDAQGHGYGTETGALLVEYVFRTSSTPTVKANAFDFNDASRGLLEDLGFEQEGRLRKSGFIDGEYRDRLTYGILREEWENPLESA